MKIAVICDVLGEANNGTTIAALNLIESLKNKGHDVRVVCCDQDKKGKDGYVVVPLLSVPVVSSVLKKNGVALARADKTILKEVIEWADLVQIELPFLLGHKAAVLAKQLGKPLTASLHVQPENVTAHLGGIKSRFVNKQIYKIFYRRTFRKADAIHYPTKFIREIFENSVGESTNGYVISNGVNEEFFRHKDDPQVRLSDKFTVLCAGRLSAEKAQYQLIYALDKSRHKDNVKVLFAGSGAKENALKKLAEKLGVDAEFRFMSRRELIFAQHAADLYVHTSLTEIEAQSCTEAIVSGLVPLICNSAGSATPVFALDDRCLFQPDNFAELAEKIDFWIENPDVLAEYRERYRQTLTAFDQKACMDKMEEMFLTVEAQ